MVALAALRCCVYILTFSCPSTEFKSIVQIQFITWPDLTAKNLCKYLLLSMATEKVYLDWVQKSTFYQNTPGNSKLYWRFKKKRRKILHIHSFITKLNDIQRKVYSDLTSKFPIMSYAGIQNLLAKYNYNNNTILAFPIKKCTDAEVVRVLRIFYTF